MSTERKVRDLEARLKLYARDRSGLTKENLEDYPGVLEALFGEDARADLRKRLELAEQVRKAIEDIVAGCTDETERLIGEAMFAIGEDLHGLGVMDRLAERTVIGSYYKRRDRVLSRVARGLLRECDNRQDSTPVSMEPFSPTARRAARQLYRYAQQALLRLEAFDLCDNFAVRLMVDLANVRPTPSGLRELPMVWLERFVGAGGTIQLVPASRTRTSDECLWSLAYSHRYLRNMLEDRSGRDFLRETLPTENWTSMRLLPVFEPVQLDRLLSMLEATRNDNPTSFVDDLLEDNHGRAIHEHWLNLLTARLFLHSNETPAALARVETISALLRLCISLQWNFTDETFTAGDHDFGSAIASLIAAREREIGILPDKTDTIGETNKFLLSATIMQYAPPRYRYDAGVANREYVWNDEPPLLDVWAGMPVQHAYVSVLEVPKRRPKRDHLRLVVLPDPLRCDGAEGSEG